MLSNANNEQDVFPEWASNNDLNFWQPDSLYVEWLTFLYTIWQKVEYL